MRLNSYLSIPCPLARCAAASGKLCRKKHVGRDFAYKRAHVARLQHARRLGLFLRIRRKIVAVTALYSDYKWLKGRCGHDIVVLRSSRTPKSARCLECEKVYVSKPNVRTKLARIQYRAEKFWRYVTKGTACWRWTGPQNKTGYGLTELGASAHHVAYVLANRRLVPRGQVIRHLCGNRNCVRPDHLELGSHYDNYLDSVAHGTVRRSTLVPALRRQILRESLAGASNKALAVRHGVAESTVSRIRMKGR